MSFKRRDLLRAGLVGGAAALSGPLVRSARAGAGEPPQVPEFELEGATVAELQEAMASRRSSAVELVQAYLQRIEAVDRGGPALNAVLEVNPDAEEIAAELDAERRAGDLRGPLHGIPVILKDNIDTDDCMLTTAGSLALEDAPPPADAGVVARLRAAGAVILAKANLSEWANFRSTRSSSGWSGRGGQTRNPYALDRNPCGSSSGSAVAVSADLCAVAVGTETDGSVVCPSNACGIVGIKPTLGLVSRAGIIPIAHSQDTAGPMGRTVADAAALLGAMAGVDDRDDATAAAADHLADDYRSFLDDDGLRGARIGVARNFLGFHERVDALMEKAIEAMRQAGAEIVDPASLETAGELGDAELEVLQYEFKADLNAYLQARGGPMTSLADLIEFNRTHADREMPYFGQEIFVSSREKGPLTEQAYRGALDKCRRLSRDEGIDKVLAEHRLDAIVAPTGGPAWVTDLVNGDHFVGGSSTMAAVAGYPSITVPAGAVYGLPVGISFFAGAWSEPTLIRLAHAFEQATGHRRPPRFLPTADLSVDDA